MTKSEELVELTADDIAKIKAEKMGNGCLWVAGVPAALISLFCLYSINWSSDYFMQSIWIPAAVVIISFLLLTAIYKFVKNNDAKIDKDLTDGRKKVIIAPITNKRIKSSEITRGREKGGISSKYFMTIAGRDYPMTEHKYLTIPVGEFMEMHLAPTSKTVLQEKWLKKDGTVEEDKDEFE